jgi:adhesin transport system membrane fusion protein
MLRRGSLIVIGLATLAVIGFFAWAAWAELDQVTRAPGEVIPSGRVQTVQPAAEGVITEILVREGQNVRKGELLVALDRVKAGAAVEEGEARVAALKATMARIEAELFDRPLAFPPEVERFPELAANQRLLFQRRRQALGADVAALTSQLALARQELELNRPLVATGDIARAELLRLQRNVSDLSGQIASRRSRYLEELQTEYARTQEELNSAEQALTQRRDDLGNAELRAPVAGLVSNMQVTTVGQVVRPGDEVMQIVPAGARLIVEARVSPADIAFIRRGQRASVKFDAFDPSVYGGADAEVIFVSPDTTAAPAPGGGQQSFYRVQLAADTGTMRPKRPGERIVIQPGMTATAEIKTGETTVFRYLTKPILKTTSEAMTER